MNLGKLAFAQVTQHLPLTTFRRFVARYGGTYKVKSFSCLDHWPMPTRAATGASTPTLPSRSAPSPAVFMPAFIITELYRCRWQGELFFKWIKQHLRIKVFFGTSENAVKPKSGLPSRFTCSSPSSRNDSTYRRACMKYYRS